MTAVSVAQTRLMTDDIDDATRGLHGRASHSSMGQIERPGRHDMFCTKSVICQPATPEYMTEVHSTGRPNAAQALQCCQPSQRAHREPVYDILSHTVTSKEAWYHALLQPACAILITASGCS